MLRTRIILVVVSAALITGIFLLPKVVVENDESMSEASSDSTTSAGMEMHARTPVGVLTSIKNLRAMFAAGSKNEKNAIFADSLADLYATAGKFDSSAWFAEEAAKFFNTQESWIKAGDQYYQAYSFAVDRNRQAGFAARAQVFYNKVLAVNPENLTVKTKLAMTFLTEANPMQAIGMLREVLATDPGNELALYNMGMLSIQSGQHDKAVNWLSKLVEVNPENTQGHLLLGIAYMNTGSKAKARAQFEKVKQLDDDPSVQATADSYLKDLK
jgi:tetratricopeptide (TPR) repeat protein